LRRIERDLDRVRHALDSIATTGPDYSPRAADGWARRSGSRRAGCSVP
jgi:hypothetical protein